MRKTVIITGASSGIGLAAARAFLDRGWNVIACMRDPTQAMRRGFDLCHAHLLVSRLDVEARSDCQEVVSQALAAFGRIDVLINNAGQGPMGALETMPIETMATTLSVNSLGPIRMCQAVLPVMRRQACGRIINVSSMGGEFTTPFAGAYHASKYALEAVSDALRIEVARFGIEVVVAQPGPVRTPLALSAVAGLRDAADGPYREPLLAMARQSQSQFEAGTGVLEPSYVASVLVQLAERRRAPSRRKIGAMARVLPALRRWLPSPLWDRMWLTMLPATG